MNKFANLLGLVILAFGLLYFLFFNHYPGLYGPSGTWAVLVGVVCILLSSIRNGHYKRLKPIFAVLSLTFLSVVGGYFGWLTNGLGDLVWTIPIVLFSLIGLVLVSTEAYRNLK